MLLFLEGIVRTGSVTAATVELAMTHSAFSRQLFQLQAWLGILPFRRKSQRDDFDSRCRSPCGSARWSFDGIHDALEVTVAVPRVAGGLFHHGVVARRYFTRTAWPGRDDGSRSPASRNARSRSSGNPALFRVDFWAADRRPRLLACL
ncbi:MAG: LysR family transcriptional regulator [Rhizobiaceae bacterium]|nr:MAG: LysR family transcriptional regulator [Rhizobiaceae bacterium]